MKKTLLMYLLLMQLALLVTTKANASNNLPPCTNTSSLKKDTVCDGDASKYPYNFNGLTITTSGTYTVHFTNAGGCDSAANLQLLVKHATILITCRVDADGDGYGSIYGADTVFNTCDGKAPIGYAINGTTIDWKDSDPTVWNMTQGLYYDGDGDGYYNENIYYSTVYYGDSLPVGYHTTGVDKWDCNDNDPTVWNKTTFHYYDGDGDGYFNKFVYYGSGQTFCYGNTPPAGYYFSGDYEKLDCDDNDSTVWQEVYIFRDRDGDGYANWFTFSSWKVCVGNTAPAGWSLNYWGDCDDQDPDINAGSNWEQKINNSNKLTVNKPCQFLGDTVLFTISGLGGGYYTGTTGSVNPPWIPPLYKLYINGVLFKTQNTATFTVTGLTDNSQVYGTKDWGRNCDTENSSYDYTTSKATTDTLTIRVTSTPLLTPTITIAASDTSVCYSSPVTFIANATNNGSSPTYTWKVNGVAVGSNDSTLTSITLTDSAVITCTLNSSLINVCPSKVISNAVKMHILQTPITNISATICAGNSYVLNGNTYTNTGLYTARIPRTSGCDSVVILNLTVNATSASTSNVTLCSNLLPHIWNGTSYTASGAYIKHLTNAKGCDSIATLNLTVKDTSLSITSIAKCSNYFPFSFNGTLYYAAGTYDKHFTSANGCDSIARLVIKPIPTSSSTKNDTAVTSYTWNGNTYTNSGTYTYTTTNAAGCDSMATLILVIQPPKLSIVTSTTSVMPTQTSVVYSCSAVAGAVSYQWSYSGSGVTITDNGNSSITISFSSGATSGVLTVVSFGASGIANNSTSVYVNVSSSGLFVSGRCISTKKYGIMNGSIKLLGSIPNASLAINSNGIYQAIIDPAKASNIVLKPTKNNDITKTNGINATDALFLQRHLLGSSKLNSAYKLIAADVTGDNKINATDVLRIKRLILGVDSTFTKGSGVNKVDRLWEFVDSAYVFPDTTNPFPFKDSISLTNLTANKTNQTFIGIKLGDVNDSWNAAVARGVVTRSVELFYHVISTKEKSNSTDFSGTNLRNDELRIPITASNFKELVAMQYTLHFDNKNYQFVGIENNKLNIDFNEKQVTTNGNIAMLWTDKNAVERTLEDGTELFVLVLKQKGIGNLELGISDAITEIAAWDKDYNQHNIILSQKSKAETQNLNNVWSVSPNPTSGDLKVNMVSKTNKAIVFELTDAQGKSILKQTAEMQKGNNNLILNLKKNGNLTAGIYFLKAVGFEGENVKRIVVR